MPGYMVAQPRIASNRIPLSNLRGRRVGGVRMAAHIRRGGDRWARTTGRVISE
jgi:hypothetical protein